uniref:Cadherin domain-containing protein n=1 Tax=Stomoxys calcitrans TaxID=35570 RepID=A0A1I8P0B1_STOCA
MKNFKNFVRLIAFVVTMYQCLAIDEVIDCSNEELVTSVFNEPIDLTFNGTVKIYENVSINEILSTSNNEFDVMYIDARLQNVTDLSGSVSLNLIIFTTENFQNYAKEQTATRISLKINLGCGSGKERILVFFQPLQEGNYYSPIFSQSRYELLMPTPIFAGFDLTAFVEISAKDDDLTQNQINFTSITSSQHHISVGTKNISSSDKKTYFANMTLERIYMELPQQIEFVITATDNGVPPRSSNATVIIRSDPINRMPIKPRFIQQLYNGTINVDFSMEPIRMQLAAGSYQPEVRFTLSGSEIRGFEITDNKNGEILIQWNPSIVNHSFIMQHKKWELELRAEHPQLAETNAANVIVELVDFQSFFHFMSTYYEGLIDTNGQLELFPIIFYPLMYRTDIKFSFLENPQNMFNLTNNNFQVNINFMPNFTLDAFANDAFIKLTLRATWEQLSAITYVVITLPKKAAENTHPQSQQMLQFEKPLYVGNFSVAHGVELETMVLQNPIKGNNNASNVDAFKLSGEGSYLFRLMVDQLSPQKSQVQLQLNGTEVVNEAMQLQTPILLILEAKRENLTTYCSIVLQNPSRDVIAVNSTTVFVAHSLIGKLDLKNGNQTLAVDAIEIRPMDNLKDYEFLLKGDESTNFELIMNVNLSSLNVILKNDLPNATIESNKILILQVLAKLKGSLNIMDTLMIFVKLPQKECHATSKPTPNSPAFPNSNYVFTTFTNTTGSLGVVRAYSQEIASIFHYILEVDNDILAQRLSIEPFSGELMLYGSIEEGTYNFNVTAENMDTHETAHIQAVLKVSQKEECKLFEGVAVEKTLVVRHIAEEVPHHGFWNMKFNENCSFRIEEMWPKDKEYAYLNETSLKLDIMPIDREDAIFESMEEAQILIKLKLLCGNEQMPLKTNSAPRSSRSLDFIDRVYMQDIIYSPDTMWLHLIIDDINDNAPQFKLKYTLDYFGYPAGKANVDIYPEYLMQVETKDLDLGINAKIRYSMRNNAYFDIEPETGKIYPKGMVLQAQQQTELIVLATDRNGEGLISGTVIIVKGLAPDFYSLITLKENSSKSLEEITQELRETTGYAVKVIKMSYVPQVQTRSSRSDQAQLVCKAWIYAFRDQQLVECKELQKKLLDIRPVPSIINIESYEEAALHAGLAGNAPSTTGYIVAVVILSIVSATSIAFIIWRFYFNGELPSNCGSRDTYSNDNGQNCGNGQRTTKEGSREGADNQHTNRVKFSSLVENVTIGDCEK